MIFFTSLRKELMEQWRTNRLLIAVVVLAVFGMTSPLMAKFMPQLFTMFPGAEEFAGLIPQPTIMDAITQYAKNISQFGILLALLLSMGSVAIEKDKGTAAMMLVKPLPRNVFITSKFTALSITLLVSLVISGIGSYYYTLLLFEAPSAINWLLMNLLMWVNLLFYVAVMVMFSTLMRSQVAAVGLGVGVLILFGIIGISPTLAKFIPDALSGWGASLVAGIPGSYWPALWISLGLTALCLLIAWLSLRRQEL